MQNDAIEYCNNSATIGEQPGDTDVFLNDVVFVIDRHYSCVAR